MSMSKQFKYSWFEVQQTINWWILSLLSLQRDYHTFSLVEKYCHVYSKDIRTLLLFYLRSHGSENLLKSIQDHLFRCQLFHLYVSLLQFYFVIWSLVWQVIFLFSCLPPICWPELQHVFFLRWTQEPVHHLLHKYLYSLLTLFCFGIST